MTPEHMQAVATDDTQAQTPVQAPPPAEEQKPVEPTANDNTAVKTAPGLSRKQKYLGMAFNVAAGAAATAGAKAASTLLLASFAVPVLGTLIVSSLAVGAAGAAVAHTLENRQLKKSGAATTKFFTRENKSKNIKRFLMSSGLAFIGGALFLGFTEGLFEKLFGSTPAVAELPPVAPAPVEVSPIDKFAIAVSTQPVTAEVAQAMARTASESAAVSAQATKDLAYYTFNGFGGVAKDQVLAVELFNQAAAAGSTQAKVDLAYIQYHGLAGVTADKTAALAAMQELPGQKAASFVKAWSPK